MTQSRKIRRAEILQAAYDDFCESGYDRARMENIARRAGIGKSTIYEYFPSKTELLLAVVEWGIDRTYHELNTIFTAKISIREIVNQYLEYMHNMAVSAAGFFMTLRNDDPAFHEVHCAIRHFFEFLVENIKATIAAAAKRGEVSAKIDPSAAALMLVSMSSPLITLGEWETTMEQVLDVLFEGLDPR
ncbi:MAG: TetR/AcrR family transcriptional regulator [Butyricicoccus pullicaecorum]|nr:TetR/AcrR family transcriptional regulator [Butyricicoccus pullicaecorum]